MAAGGVPALTMTALGENRRIHCRARPACRDPIDRPYRQEGVAGPGHHEPIPRTQAFLAPSLRGAPAAPGGQVPTQPGRGVVPGRSLCQPLRRPLRTPPQPGRSPPPCRSAPDGGLLPIWFPIALLNQTSAAPLHRGRGMQDAGQAGPLACAVCASAAAQPGLRPPEAPLQLQLLAALQP